MIHTIKSIILSFLIFSCFVLQAQQGIITTIIGTGTAGYGGDDGQASVALLGYPTGVCSDKHGNIYIADGNSTVRKVNAVTGIITTVAGTGTYGYNGDNMPATMAQLHYPVGVAVDTGDNIFIGESAGARIRRVDAATGIITTYAGTGTMGSFGENIPATDAQLPGNGHICLDRAGILYLSEGPKVRKVSVSGIIATYAGTGIVGYTGDNGPATVAQIQAYAIAADISNNIYIADQVNNIIRKIDAVTYDITTIGGGGVSNAENVPATTASITPYNLCVDNVGNVFIVNHSAPKIRKITPSGIINTVAGTGATGYSGDHGPATAARINTEGVYVDDSGSIYIADGVNTVVRKVTYCRGNPVAALIDTGGGQTHGYTYTGTTVLYDSVRWNFGDGDTSHALNPIHTYTANGTYHACVTVYTDCGSDSACKDVVITHVGVPFDKLTMTDVQVWPNPVKSQLNVDNAARSDLSVYDIVSGSARLTMTIKNDKEVIDVSSLPRGMYIVEIVDKDTGEKVVRRVVKE